MSQARCTIQVKGLDCPTEVAELRAALKDQPGITSLGFDLIHGLMTVDHSPDSVRPEHLAKLIAERTGMQATLVGQPEGLGPSWWAQSQQWILTIGSGLALAVGTGFSWLGPAIGLDPTTAERLAMSGYALAVVIGGIGLFPRAVRNIRRLRLDIDVLMGLAIL